MLKDSNASVLLTYQQDASRRSEYQIRTIDLDSDWNIIAQEYETNCRSMVSAEDLAYIIYTSGTTGQPKGVMIGHRGLCNMIESSRKLLKAEPDSRFIHAMSFSFDAATSVLFTALCSGAALYILRRDQTLDEILNKYKITHLQAIPSMLVNLPDKNFPTLQLITVGGETCPVDLAEKWAKGRRFFNVYGPTETTIRATAYQYIQGSKKLPIGRPIDNVQVYILDRHIQPVPIGVPGEIYIGGAGLAKGYLNRPKLTAEGFITNPFDPNAKSRLYKTGDLARYLPDGNIEFLGRIDEQVKIRGFRIELGEIESTIKKISAVKEALVVADKNKSGYDRLIGYIVPDHPQSLSEAQIKDFLNERLPHYMVPPFFVFLEKFLLTANGKIDRRALPIPTVAHPKRESFIAPQGPVEEMVVELWQETLKIDLISTKDNFFELGGDSLLAVQFISRLYHLHDIDLPLRYLFEHPTIVQLAPVIEEILLKELEDQKE
jgi:amino acid adenylation domain-containing protein